MNPVSVLSARGVLSASVVHEIECGAHVVLEDDGALYRTWHARGEERLWSEHCSSMPVFDVVGTTGTVLLGTSPEGHTWLQWERSARCTCAHCVDWFWYVFTCKNQGPQGSTYRTESNPIVLRHLSADACHRACESPLV